MPLSQLTYLKAQRQTLCIPSLANEQTSILSISVVCVHFNCPSERGSGVVLHHTVCDLVCAVVLQQYWPPSYCPGPENIPRCSSKSTAKSEWDSPSTAA